VNFAAGAEIELLKRELLQVFIELDAVQNMITAYCSWNSSSS